MMELKPEKKKLRQFNPLDVTESLGYTTYRRDSRKPWSKEEDFKLSEIINNKLIELGFKAGIQSLNATSADYAQSSQKLQDLNWDEISDQLQTRKAKDCRKRWTNSLDPNLRKGKWTPEEDEMLIASFQKHGSSWQKISPEIPGRTDDQCAKRYIEVLDPKTKDRLRPWSLEEDLSLIRKVKIYGTKWRTISLEMMSRPSLTCRNRWRKIVTEVVRGKANPEIKKEIDSFEGGLSKIEEISENLQSQKKSNVKKPTKGTKKTKKTKDDPEAEIPVIKEEEFPPLSSVEPVYQPLPQQQQQAQQQGQQKQQQTQPQIHQQEPHQQHQPQYNQPKQQPAFHQSTLPNGNNNMHMKDSRSRLPVSTEMDWKFTLKDTSGLTLSNGNISTTELAKQLIENAKKYDLKISIHQHIHNHYSSNTHFSGRVTSPGDSSSNQSGNVNPTDETYTPNRYSHFNYLPPMVQPQLESSSYLQAAREHDLSRLLNPSAAAAAAQGIAVNDPTHSSHGRRRVSNSSGNSRKKRKLSNDMNYEELEDELDFWETMRSLSHFSNTGPPHPAGGSSNANDQSQQQHHHRHQHDAQDNVKMGLYYTTEQAENVDMDPDELEENFRELSGFSGVLPFNPS